MICCFFFYFQVYLFILATHLINSPVHSCVYSCIGKKNFLNPFIPKSGVLKLIPGNRKTHVFALFGRESGGVVSGLGPSPWITMRRVISHLHSFSRVDIYSSIEAFYCVARYGIVAKRCYCVDHYLSLWA